MLHRGLCQGDSLSSLLFMLVIEALSVAFTEDKIKIFFHGVEAGVNKVHVSHIQFADDALILGDCSKPNIENMSTILTCFHLASNLKVNFNKSKLSGIGTSQLGSTLLLPLSGAFLLISHVLTWVFSLAPTWQDVQSAQIFTSS
ncbi:putative RNA-directed DNA polymerase, eukaryota, reverse transcriptase zinc-binding domain protein [Tanacetum coccineum]